MTLSDAELRLAAIAQLENDLEEGAPRLQRMAGLALAQLSHKPALTFLRERLTSETSDLSRVDIAYGLALAGEEAGHAYLLSELKSKRRDVRVDDRPPDAIEAGIHRRTHPLGRGQFLLDALEDQDVRIDADADGQDETGNAWQRHGGTEIRHHPQQNTEVHTNRDNVSEDGDARERDAHDAHKGDHNRRDDQPCRKRADPEGRCDPRRRRGDGGRNPAESVFVDEPHETAHGRIWRRIASRLKRRVNMGFCIWRPADRMLLGQERRSLGTTNRN